ncbi:hypothetical protein [Kitasatospora kazusensis]
MTIPGFQAEASAYRSTGGYLTGPPRGATGDRIVPALTDRQQQLADCYRQDDACYAECTDLEYPLYEECAASCNAQFDQCVNPDPPQPRR